MELDFQPMVQVGISTEPEVRWWYICIAEEVEWMGFTAVRYVIWRVYSRPYILECTQWTEVSDIVVCSVQTHWCGCLCCKRVKLKHTRVYRNAIMFCVNFTCANFASADGITKKRSQWLNLCEWLLVGVVNGHVDIETMNLSWLSQKKQR